MDRSQTPAIEHQEGDVVAGFRIDRVTTLGDLRAQCYEARHQETGAQLIHVACNDVESLFSVGFQTLPEDSTGVAHILEHSVLAGSARYPVKDAFNELGKRTLNTFLNAMTWPDRTVYPVCSAVKKDLFNLASVYMDLVFNPRLSLETFQQEGHHLELEDADDADSALKVSGVVYNEMHGVYSAPEAIVRRAMLRKLLPDTIYGVDSGGDPEDIPELTWEGLKAFHARHYAPENARFLLYGHIPLSEQLAFIDERLRALRARKNEAPAIAPQPRWTEPRTAELVYPVGATDPTAKKTFCVFTWMLNDTKDALESLLLEILCETLYGSAAGPVRKALVDAGLGEDVFPRHSYSSDAYHASASFGLRGTEPDQVERIEAVVLDTLRAVATEGIDPDLVEAALHQIEFAGKAIDPPFPIMLLVRANPLWYYGGDPKAGFAFGDLVDQARALIAAEPRLLEGRVERWFLDNPHRLRIVATPSTTLAAEQKDRLTKRLAERRAAMSTEQLAAVRTEAEQLLAAQTAPESPEAIASLPTLGPDDIPSRLLTVPITPNRIGGVELDEHPVFSNGVGYVSLSFDISDLPEDLIPYLPLMGRITLGTGAGGLDYSKTATRIGRTTGDLVASPLAGRVLGSGASWQQFSILTEVLARNAARAGELLRDLLTRSEPEPKRVRDLIQEIASQRKSALVPSGHMFAFRRAGASLGGSFWRREQWSGFEQVRLLAGVVKDLTDARVAEVIAKVQRLQRLVFTKGRMFVNLAGDEAVIAELRPVVEALIEALPDGEAVGAATPAVGPTSNPAGIVIPAEVCYCGQVLEVPDMLDPAAPALELLSAILDSELLYQKVRVQGGAYGGFAFYSAIDAVLPMLSYRDPNLEGTFAVFDEVPAFLRSGSITDELVESVRLGAIGSFDRVLAPGQQLLAARARRFSGVSDEARAVFREGLLTANAAAVQELALPAVERALAVSRRRAVLAAKPRLEGLGDSLGGPLDLLDIEAT